MFLPGVTFSSAWNIALPIMAFLPMSFAAFRLLFGHVVNAGFKKYSEGQCPTPIQGKLPFQLQYLGGYAPRLENTLCVLVALFHPIFQPEGVNHTPFVLDILTSLSAPVIVSFLEAARSKRPLLLGFPVVIGVVYQLFTGAVIFPVYWGVFLAITRDHAVGSEIVQADAEAVLFGLVMGYFIPTFVMAYMTTPKPIAVWQIFPVLIYIFKGLHLSIRPRRLHNSSGYRTVQATYIIIFLISSIVHLRVLAAYKFDPQTIMTAFMPPLEIPVAKTGQAVLSVINLFLQWDAVFIFGSTFMASLWFARSILEGILLMIWIVISSTTLGPGAAISAIFLWREANLNHTRQILTPHAKTQ